MHLHAHHKLFFSPSSSLFFPLLTNTEAGQSAFASELKVSIVIVQVLLCQFVIVYVGLNCVLMYIGNDKEILYLWTIKTSSRILAL